MDDKPLDDLPEKEPDSIQKPTIFQRLTAGLTRMGLGEIALRFVTNFLSMLLIFSVVWLMQYLFRGMVSPGAQEDPAFAGTAAPAPEILLQPGLISVSLDGIARQASIHTTIPSRPRIDVIQYTVQIGDSVFGIAEKFNLNPSTILFGNYDTLKDNPHLLKPEQVLNILPVDGTYHQWVGGGAESLSGIGTYFGVDPEIIVNFPGNHLDPETVGDYDNASIPAGTWLIIPGGKRDFTSWYAPIGVTRSSPATTRVLGLGACGAISGGSVGYGTFIWPTPKHYISGYQYSPDTNHPAIDIGGNLGDAVAAMDAGVIVYAGWNDWGYGNLIIVDHGDTATGSWQSLYAHLDAVLVSCGQSVGQGELIGLLGSTGNSSGPHLHLELMNLEYGKVNPLNFLPPP